MPGPHQVTAAVLPGPDQVPGALLVEVGTATGVISSRRSSRARWMASLASVLTRSPGGRCSFDGAATTQLPGAGDVCLLRTRDAQLAADAVAAALPSRYRPVVAAMLLLEGDDMSGGLVAGVAVASAQVLSEAIRFKSLVLSRSEPCVGSSLLRAALYPEPAAGRWSRWGRLTRRFRGVYRLAG